MTHTATRIKPLRSERHAALDAAYPADPPRKLAKAIQRPAVRRRYVLPRGWLLAVLIVEVVLVSIIWWGTR
jgi:hypothetical protein